MLADTDKKPALPISTSLEILHGKLGLARAAFLHGHLVASLDYALGALHTAQHNDDKYLAGLAEECAGIACMRLGRFAEAVRYFLDALTIFDLLKRDRESGSVLCQFAFVHHEMGDYDEALDLANRALEFAHGLADSELEAEARYRIGNIYRMMGKFSRALEFIQDALRCAELANAPMHIGRALWNLGCVYTDRGVANAGHPRAAQSDFENSLATSRRALAILEQAGYSGAAIPLGSNIAFALMSLGQFEDAISRYDHLLQQANEYQDQYMTASIITNYGKTYCAMQRYDLATDYLQRALVVAQRMDFVSQIANIESQLATCAEAQGNHKRALDHYKNYHAATMAGLSANAERRAAALAVKWHLIDAQRAANVATRRASELADTVSKLQSNREALLRQSHEDPLTGLANRRVFDATLAEHLRAPHDYSRVLCLAMCDVDRFKSINDRFSHMVGDLVLQRLAAIFRREFRSSDLIARFGGEEFSIILDDVALATAINICNRTRLAIEKEPWEQIHENLAVTVSFGVAAFRPGSAYDTLLAQADANLYRAKENGRNLVVGEI